MDGLIFKALGGFYYVRTPSGDIECRPVGIFRREGISPMVGDWVTVEPTEDGRGSLTQILPRKNSLLRPPVANLDRLAMVVSCTQPLPNILILDKLTAIACHRGIPVLLIFSKIDLASPEPWSALYRRAGFRVFEVDSLTGEGTQEVKRELSTGVTAFCGNSGTGKSSLLNALFPELHLLTDGISKKLGRGKHTTRHVELYHAGSGGYIADTPGFSAVDFLQFERMTVRDLAGCFPEFAGLPEKCQFGDCSHTSERGCAVLEAVEAGKIPPSRHQSYCAIYDELKQVKEWEL